MSKIGLDTGHRVINYGTKLQAYAMQNLIEQYGYDVEIVQFNKKYMKLPLVPSLKNTLQTAKIYKKNSGLIHYMIKRNSSINSFDKKLHIRKIYGDYKSRTKEVAGYKAMFCGSDQAWLPVNVANHQFTLEYAPEGIIRASYAPSFGVSSIPEDMKEAYREFLGKMDYLSIRELDGKQLIKDITGMDIPRVLDPTILIGVDFWNKVVDESLANKYDKYIFCYFLGDTKDHRQAVKKLSKKTGYKIINLPHFIKYNDADKDFADINLYKVTPEQFLGLIKNTAMVCSDSFHCTAFSIQFHKEFVAFERFKKSDKESTNGRLYTLLQELDLGYRMYPSCSIEEYVGKTIDYTICEEKLTAQKMESRNYMDNVFRGINSAR